MGAVSPVARAKAKMAPVMIPGRAAGKTTVRMAAHFPAPRASAPSRKERGTVLSDSSLALMVQGRLKSPKVSPLAKTLPPKFRARTNKASPNRP